MPPRFPALSWASLSGEKQKCCRKIFSDGGIAGADGVVEPSDVAAEAIAAIEEKRFLALPHASVAGYEAARATQRDRWLGGMRKFRRMMVAERGRPV